MASRGNAGIQSVLAKLEDAVKNGKYYEAHQMYRTLYFRLLSKKKYDELLKLLKNGAFLMLQHGDKGSGADLAILLVDVLTKSGTMPNNEWISALAELFALISPAIPDREKFLTVATYWSMGANQQGRGHPLWHKKIAEIFWKEENYTLAHPHYRLSSDGETYAKRLIELHLENSTCGNNKCDIDFFITKAVLQFLSKGNLVMGQCVYTEYIANHPTLRQLKGPPFEQYPLLNFLNSLLEIFMVRNADQFLRLREIYASALAKEPIFGEYVEVIGRKWFGIAPPNERQGTPAGLLGGLLRALMAEADGESSDDDKLHTAAPAPLTSSSSQPQSQLQVVPEIPDLD